MGRNRKPNGQNNCYDPVPNSAFFKKRIAEEGGYTEYRNGGSHFQGHLNGEQTTAYDSDEYPRGTACFLGKWLAKAIAKTVVVAAVVLALASYLS